MFSNWAHRFDNTLSTLRAVRDLAEAERLVLGPHGREILESVGRDVLDFCMNLELGSAETRTRIFLGDANGLLQRQEWNRLATAMDEIERLLKQDMMEVCFESIPKGKLDYYNAGFGPEVDAAFPSALPDIREGNTCYALGRNTACVFHMMRAAEIALRVLTWDRRVLTKQAANVTNWNALIDKLSRVIDDMGKLAASNWRSAQIKETQLRFYHEAMLEFRSFNQAYRRHVSHARDDGHYDEGQAQSVREHTEAFLRILAVKISEARRATVIWRSA